MKKFIDLFKTRKINEFYDEAHFRILDLLLNLSNNDSNYQGNENFKLQSPIDISIENEKIDLGDWDTEWESTDNDTHSIS